MSEVVGVGPSLVRCRAVSEVEASKGWAGSVAVSPGEGREWVNSEEANAVGTAGLTEEVVREEEEEGSFRGAVVCECSD